MKSTSIPGANVNKSIRTESLSRLTELCKEKLPLAEKFELNQSFEMAYVARWSIIEQVTKHIAASASAIRLRSDLKAWLEYLDDPKRIRPAVIRSFVSDPVSAKLPQTSVLVEVLGEVPNLSDVLDTSKKFRRKRNAIAHDAEPFGSLQIYEDYKAKLESATLELKSALQKRS